MNKTRKAYNVTVFMKDGRELIERVEAASVDQAHQIAHKKYKGAYVATVAEEA